MANIELRDLEQARSFLIEGLWWQRIVPPDASQVAGVLEWAKEIAVSGQPLPPIGFVADVGNAACRIDSGASKTMRSEAALPPTLLRSYEDHVLGKFYADWTFARSGDMLRRWQGRDRARGLAFVIERFQERAGFPGVLLSPGTINTLLRAPPEELLAEGWANLQQHGPQPLLVQLYEALVVAARRTAEVLGPEDLPELESGAALQTEGPRLARRQVRRAAALLETALPSQRPRPRVESPDSPTHILDADTYPVGGYNSISNRGPVESLLHSQLAYMDDEQRPDLFDVRFLRDELLYYARDENEFLRRRRTFIVALSPDLIMARFKDRDLPYQRIVLLLAFLFSAIRKTIDWLAADALAFEVLWIRNNEQSPLTMERALLESLLADRIETGVVRMVDAMQADVVARCITASRRSLCRCVIVGAAPMELSIAKTQVTRITVAEPRPTLSDEAGNAIALPGGDPVECWSQALDELLHRWL